MISLVLRGSAAAITAHLITAPALVDKTPGADFRVGTADDDTVAAALNARQSAPNLYGAASFALLDDLEGGGLDEIMFVDGTIEFTPDYAASTPDTLMLRVTRGALRATAECHWPMLGDQGATLGSGTVALGVTTGVGSAKLDGVFGRPNDDFPLVGETLTSAPGGTLVVLAPSFGRSGVPYVDRVLVPLVPAGATSIVVTEFTGTTVTPGCCAGFSTHGVLAAYTTEALGCGDAFPTLCNGSPPCTTITDCCAAVGATLPSASTSDKKLRRVAKRLARLDGRKTKLLVRAATAKPKKQGRFYAKVKQALTALVTAATKADGTHTLGASLKAVTAAVDRLVRLLPS
jgi:hypothetical protein